MSSKSSYTFRLSPVQVEIALHWAQQRDPLRDHPGDKSLVQKMEKAATRWRSPPEFAHTAGAGAES